MSLFILHFHFLFSVGLVIIIATYHCSLMRKTNIHCLLYDIILNVSPECKLYSKIFEQKGRNYSIWACNH